MLSVLDQFEPFALARYPEQIRSDGLHVELIGRPIELLQDANYLYVGLDREEFPDGIAVKWRILLSRDGGKTWSPRPNGELDWQWDGFPYGYTAPGGRIRSPLSGVESLQSDSTIVLPYQGDSGRWIRVDLIPLKPIATRVLVRLLQGPEVRPFFGPIHHSVAFDAATVAGNVNAASTISKTHTPVSGSVTGVGVGFGGYTVGGAGFSSGSYGGTAMAKTGSNGIESLDAVSGRSPTIFGLNDLVGIGKTGAQSALLTQVAGIYGDFVAITITGGDTTTLFSNTASANGTSTTPSVTCTTANDELIMDANCTSTNESPSVGANQTQRMNSAQTGIATYQMGSTQAGADGGVMSWTLVGSTSWRGVAGSFKAGGGGATLGTPYYYREHIARDS